MVAQNGTIVLGAVTHFGQLGNYSLDWLGKVVSSNSLSIRDGISWSLIEQKAGQYNFPADKRVTYIDAAIKAGLDPIVHFNPQGHKLYDGGKTLTSDRAIDAFANFIVATLDEYPGLRRIEIGNEFNTNSSMFVSGTALTPDLAKRAEIYTKILAGVAESVRETHPDVTIIGGALHSVPTGYVRHLAEAGAFAHMDALAFHPYSQEPGRVGQSLAVLNAVLAELPVNQRPALIASEFGRPAEKGDPAANTEYLVKMIAEMGAAGVGEATWQQFIDNDASRWPNMGLYDAKSGPNPLFDGFRHLASIVNEGQKIVGRSVDDTVRMIDLGKSTVIWGSHQDVSFNGKNLVFRDVMGDIISKPTEVGRSPIFVEGDFKMTPLAAGRVIADSYYEFDLLQGGGGGWSYHGLKTLKGKSSYVDLTLKDGQTIMGESWNPYLAFDTWRPFQMDGFSVRPMGYSLNGTNERATVDRYTAEATGKVDIVASWSVSASSTDGVRVTITHNGKVLHTEAGKGDHGVVVQGVNLRVGDVFEFQVDDNGASTGDSTARHIRILAHDPKQDSRTLFEDHLHNDEIEGNETARLIDRYVSSGIDGVDTELGGNDADAVVQVLAQGTDRVVSTPRDDDLDVGSTRTGTNEPDRLIGTDGGDRLFGLNGNDSIYGGAGDDYIDGGQGRRDVLDGGTGDDTLLGGGGKDVFVFSGNFGNDVVLDFSSLDTLHIEVGAALAAHVGRSSSLEISGGVVMADGDEVRTLSSILQSYGKSGVDSYQSGSNLTFQFGPNSSVTLFDYI